MDLRDPSLRASDVIAALALQPHPEGGFFRESFRDGDLVARGVATTIYFLLPRGVVSAWHRVDAVEIWLWHGGAPLVLEIAPPGESGFAHRLGPDIGLGESFQGVVAKNHWQRAWSAGDWTLVSCVVAPAFLFSGFEMAPPGWEP